MRLFVVAGEPSGDLLGAALLRGLASKGIRPALAGIGGPAMSAEGFTTIFPMEELSVMGIAEVLPRLPRLLRRIAETAEAAAAFRPDALVTIDSPDFTLRVARRFRKAMPGVPVIHYVAPSVWAWRPGRAAKMARAVDHVLCLLPFEPPYMEAAGMGASFVGHPAAAEPLSTEADIAALRGELGIGSARTLLLLPGSRRSEHKRLLPIFAEIGRRVRVAEREIALVMPVPDHLAQSAREAVGNLPISVIGASGGTTRRAAYAMADLALAASGTVSLELARQSCPMIVAYAMNPISARLARRLVKLDTVTLVNLVTDTRAVPEFLLEDCKPDLIFPQVMRYLTDPALAEAQLETSARAMEILGAGDTSPGARAAVAVIQVLQIAKARSGIG